MKSSNAENENVHTITSLSNSIMLYLYNIINDIPLEINTIIIALFSFIVSIIIHLEIGIYHNKFLSKLWLDCPSYNKGKCYYFCLSNLTMKQYS